MKKLLEGGKLWTMLSALVFIMTCCMFVYATTSSNTFDSWKTNNLTDATLTADDWDSLMERLNNLESIPDGAIMAFKTVGGCPTGWKRFSEADDKILKGYQGNNPQTEGEYRVSSYSTNNSTSNDLVSIKFRNVTYCIKDLNYEEPHDYCNYAPNGSTTLSNFSALDNALYDINGNRKQVITNGYIDPTRKFGPGRVVDYCTSNYSYICGFTNEYCTSLIGKEYFFVRNGSWYKLNSASIDCIQGKYGNTNNSVSNLFTIVDFSTSNNVRIGNVRKECND